MSTILKVNNVSSGGNPTAFHFMKDVFQSEPPTPKYDVVWNIDIVLSYLRNQVFVIKSTF